MQTCRTSRARLLLIAGLTLASLCLLAERPASVRAGTFTVDTTEDNTDYDCYDGDCSLRAAIETALPGDTILFDSALSGQTITLTVGQLDIDRDLTIDGSALSTHVKISGNGAVRVFAIHGVTVSLISLDISKGKATDGFGGGGIYTNGTLAVVDCAVSDSSTPGNGGGIRNDSGALVITDNSVIAGNSAGYGGGIRNDNGTLTVNDSTLINNSADFGGGIDNYAGSMTLVNTAIESNTATYYGGGLTTGATATIEDSLFRENSADSGGGIDSHAPGVTLTLTGCTLTGNTAAVNGGGLLNDEATVEANNSAFTNNLAHVAGGGIYNADAGTATINDSVLSNNTASGATEGYGGAIENMGALHLKGSTVKDNTARYNGGAIENWEGDLTVDGCIFAANDALSGGAINNNMNSTMTVAGSTFRENTANAGGGIYNDNESVADLSSSAFITNTAVDTTGGGINNAWGTLTVANCTFSDNTAASYGGGIHNQNGTLTLSHGTFAGNAAGGGGGVSNGPTGTLNYRNTLIGGSPSGGDCLNDGAIGVNVKNLVQDSRCSAALSGDPGLAALGDNGGPAETHALLSGSQALDAGDAATCLATDQRGATRPADGDASGTATCDIGAFELGGLLCGIQTGGAPNDYLFLGDVNLHVADIGSNLDCLRVTDFPSNHPAATPPLQTGKYWQVDALTDLLDPATTDYLVDLTLPYGAADADNRVCRFTGNDWDCAAASYIPGSSVTRTDIAELSPWTVGSGDCAGAVVPDSAIGLAGIGVRDVRLSWIVDPADVGGYPVYRSASPYYVPGADSLLATRPAGATSYLDLGAAETADISYTYIVRGLSNCGAPSDDGPRLGVFSFGLMPGQ